MKSVQPGECQAVSSVSHNVVGVATNRNAAAAKVQEKRPKKRLEKRLRKRLKK
ncbi:MAG: hypothetical protein ABWY14_10880 [Tardiphaga sp.]|jgi:hypothetical protein